jgi:DmsE family decaheme c-type cytochrome
MCRWTHLLFLMPLVVGSTVIALRAQPPGADSTKDKAKSSDQAQKYVRPSDASLYVGSETCKTCHEDMPSKDFFKNYEGSPHFVTTLETKKGPEWQGCEACHGPGKAHVEGGGDKTKIFTFRNASAREISERCLDCHQNGQEHANFGHSAHLQNGVGCTDCHDPHHAKESRFLMKASQPELCYSCHLQQRPQFEMPFRHRVNEGLVQCSDCHNPHGTVRPKQVRRAATQDAVCFTCHADKQGPFVFEHQPVKVEGCQSCHMPHGSPNVHLVKFSNVNLLCLQCHTNSNFNAAGKSSTGVAPGIPSFHNQQSQFQACTLCHVEIHGSNLSRTFFK